MSIHIIPDRDASGQVITHHEAFASKAVAEGNLYRRKHGFKSEEIAPNSSGIIELVIPYNAAKINQMELVNAREGDTVDLKAYDTPTGTISGVANYMLNQYAFKLELPNGYYMDKSDYNADFIKDMKIEVTYYNNGDTPHIVRGNIIYNEVKV